MSDRTTPDFTSCSFSPLGCDRRRFIGLVGASVAAQWLVRPPSLGWSATVSAPSGTSLIPGCLRSSDLLARDETLLSALSDFRTPLHHTVRRAIPEGWPLEFVSSVNLKWIPDAFPTGRARIWIHGVLPPGNVQFGNGLESLHLEADIAPIPGVGPYGHYVWGLDTGPVENLSGATTFDVPVEKRSKLCLWTSFERAQSGLVAGAGGKGGDADGELIRFSTVLTRVDRYGEPKLRPGVYCLPLSDDAQQAFPLVANRDWLVPDDLPYLLLSVQSVE